MKIKTQMNERGQVKISDWLGQEEEEDFLVGKTPKDLSNDWEEE